MVKRKRVGIGYIGLVMVIVVFFWLIGYFTGISDMDQKILSALMVFTSALYLLKWDILEALNGE